jgi:L-rhamnose-H+ transport protein
MLFDLSFLLIIFSGIINGSFIISTRKMRIKNNEQVWKWYGIFGYVLIPWLIVVIFAPTEALNFFSLPTQDFLFIFIGGLFFGFGQLLFAYAIETIGIALSFAINLGIGTVIGSMFTVLYQHQFFSFRGALTLAAVFLTLIGLVLYYVSSKKDGDSLNPVELGYNFGCLLAIVTGLTTGLQNIVFVSTSSLQQHLFQHLGSFWVWPLFLLSASIPFIVGFHYRMKQKSITPITFQRQEWARLFLMGMCFTGSLLGYSWGSSSLGAQKEVIAWPAFMVSIILITQIWGVALGEFKDSRRKAGFVRCISIGLMIVAIIVLGGALHR